MKNNPNNKICEKGTYETNGIDHFVICSVINDNCCFIRYCAKENRIKMLSSYVNCIGRKDA